jgi:tRNA(adenine34) deaminase
MRLAMNKQDCFYMQKALELAKLAEANNEVPVGAVVVLNNTIIATGYNSPLALQDATAHAEIVALRAAAQHLSKYRLLNATLYVTLEPCVMCVGAMIHFRIGRLVFGARDPRYGAVVSKFNLLAKGLFNHNIDVIGEVLAELCGELLVDFFKRRRN